MSQSSTTLSSLIAPSFHGLHKQLKTEQISECWMKGGRGSTKSSDASIEILLGLTKDKEAHALVSRRYDNELRDSVFGQMQWAADKLGIAHLWRFMVSPMQAVNTLTGQKVIFRGVDNPLKAKSINLGKGYIKYLWFEEVDQYASMEEIRSIVQSVFRGGGSGKIAFFTFNPPKSARSWVNAEVKIPKKGRIVHHSDYRSVDPAWLGERFIEDAEHLARVNETAYRHEYLGEEVGTGLEVFNNVTLRKIDHSEYSHLQTMQGLDWGYAVDPVVFLRGTYDSKRRRLFLFREISGIGISNRNLADRMTADEKRTLTYADSAEPKSIEEMRSEHLCNFRGAKKGPGSVETGIKWLADLEEIVIDPEACPLAAREFINYALEINRSGEVVSRYPDKENHALDGVRYMLGDIIGVRKATVPTQNIRGMIGF